MTRNPRNLLPLALAAIGLAVSSPSLDAAYLFTSFRGSGDGLHLAYSPDARRVARTAGSSASRP